MSKKIYILFIVSILTSSVFGQFVGKDNLSISLFYMQKTELDSAKKYIDLAIIDDNLKSTPKTWYYRGFIYKELYKKKEKENKVSPLRLISIESFKTMLTLEGKDEFTESAFKILKYEASTLYNDAARMLDPKNYRTAVSNYQHYRRTMLLINPNIDLKSRDVKFKLALASMLNRPAETSTGLDSAQAYLIKTLYIEILSIEANNSSANYNLAILYYNQGADIINNMDYDMDITKLNEVQDRCVELFLKGLPYMKKSYELTPNKMEILIGLKNIYYGLNDLEKSEMFKLKLEHMEAKKRYPVLKNKIKSLKDKGMKDSEEYVKYKTELQNLLNKFKDLEKE
ncbi:MAG: hypothetical protein JKX68_13690 [Flavobacteriales bacterium]|nr:hypothetical protein [Flavobacteriales bacterium]